jgi:predicted TIM-barrel fold metal-dependent hydrolase
MGYPDILPSPECSYVESAPMGTMEPQGRLTLLDEEGLSKAVLCPTLGLLWEAEVSDPELSDAYCRAYNRWIVDYCSEGEGRLFPIAHISFADVDLATVELERAVEAGCKGAMFPAYTWTGKAHGHPYYDKLWAKAQELDVPMALLPTFEPLKFQHFGRFEGLGWQEPVEFSWYVDVLVPQAM